MRDAIEEAREFLQRHADWDDDDCRKAFRALEELVSQLDCLDRRECYEMYTSTTTIAVDSVDIAQIGRKLQEFGQARQRIGRELDKLGIPFEEHGASDVVHAISRRLQTRFEDDTTAHAGIVELFEEVDRHARTTAEVAALDYITEAFEDEDWVVETLAVIAAKRDTAAWSTAMREKEAS
jgi:hypothetical protein